MNEWVRRSLSAGALAAGAVVATGAAAHADTTMISKDNTGILNGTQVYAPVQAPINLCGVAAAVAGKAIAGCEGGSAASNKDRDARMISADNTGVLNGTQVFLPIQAPINVCGVAVGVLGHAFAHCDGGASATLDGGRHHHKDGHHKESIPAATQVLDKLPLGGLPVVGPLLNGLLGGSTTDVDIDALDSITESGRVESETEGGQGGGKPTHPPAGHHPPKHHGNDVTMISTDNVGILNGTQVYAPVQLPIDVSGIAVGVLGHAFAHSDGGSSARM